MIRLIPKSTQKISCQNIKIGVNKNLNNPIALIRTCKRERETLQTTKESLRYIGFNQIEIFYDLDMRGSIWSFKESIKDILSKYAGWILICEDDVIFSNSTYKILNRLELSENQTISLFVTAEQDTLLKDWGWNKVVGDFNGSLAYFAHTELLSRILETDIFKTWPRKDRVDQMWSLACQELQCDFIVTKPSLAQHIGETSTINSSRVLDFRRVSFNFKKEL